MDWGAEILKVHDVSVKTLSSCNRSFLTMNAYPFKSNSFLFGKGECLLKKCENILAKPLGKSVKNKTKTHTIAHFVTAGS